MGKLPISEIKIYKNLDEVKLQPNEILVAWEVNSQTEKEIDIRGAYGWYNSVTEAKKEQKKFPENILFEVGSKQDFAWNIWFGAKKIANVFSLA